MFKSNPEVMQFFYETNQRTGAQPRALADSIIAYVTKLDRLNELGDAVEHIAQKHCALNIKPEHYAIVHDNLMASIAEVLGDIVTPEIGAAWSEAVMALAKILIARDSSSRFVFSKPTIVLAIRPLRKKLLML
jgi:nitric oxide dioxygenase